MPLAYRLATVSDAAAIARLHVASWRETYTGLLPAVMLADLSAESRAAMWEAVLDAPARRIGTRVHLAEEEGEVVGFGACGGQRDEGLRDRGFVGEFGAIYVLRSHQGGGVGRALMRLMARDLMARSMPSASLWVLDGNARARALYERLGGTILADKETVDGGVTLHEVAYGWTSLTSLI
jgi:ribosomal protein S18 acetylase RimI-like enzyme